jgi:hypothetical protein
MGCYPASAVRHKRISVNMTAKVRKLRIGVTLTVAVSLAIVLLAPSPVVPAEAYEVGKGNIPLSITDFSVVPQSIVDNATELAAELFGRDETKCHDFISQLLAIYLAAEDKDVVIFVNSGGWGWSSIEDFPYGHDLVAGVEAELNSLGYTTLWLDHYRTAHSLNGCLSELMLAPGLYPSKAEDLALRAEFLTNHIPDIKVILAGISNGCTVCEGAIRILKDNQQVYSVQLGPPFWNRNLVLERSLILRSNGVIPDPFSQGNLFIIIRANLEAMFGISQDNPGHILLYIGAPGHDYRWQHPEVRSQIIDFLDKNFALK